MAPREAAAATTARASTGTDAAELEIRNAFGDIHTNTGVHVRANEPPTVTTALAATADAGSSASAGAYVRGHGAKKKRQRPRTRPKKLSALQHRAVEYGSGSFCF